MTETPQNPEGQPGVSPDSAAPAAGSNPGDSTPTPVTPQAQAADRTASDGRISGASSAAPESAQSEASATPTNPTNFTAPAASAPQPTPAASATPTGADATPTAVYAAHAAPHAPQGASFGPAAISGPPTTDATQTGPGVPKVRRGRRLVVPLVAALAIGAIIGGASGAGIVLATGANSTTRVVSEASDSSSNVVVNRASDATTVTAVAAEASPSVVTISVSGGSSAGTGSGVILSDDGYVLTNTHVVTLDGAAADATIKVQTSDGKYWDATLIGTDPIVDLAVIKLTDASGLTPITWGDSSQLNVGDSAIAIGAPLGLSGTVTDGIVSALNRSISIASSAAPDTGDSTDSGNGSGDDFWNFDLPGQSGTTTATASISLPVIQTDAAINPGNSGGALLNSAGELIGINVAIASASGSSTSSGQSGSIGVGFSIPSNLAQRVANEIIATGSATHGLLGASVQNASTADNTASIAGAYIAQVTSGGAAEKAGIKAGDVITAVDGNAVGSSTDLTAQIRFLAGGATTTLTYVRSGTTYETDVTLGTYTP